VDYLRGVRLSVGDTIYRIRECTGNVRGDVRGASAGNGRGASAARGAREAGGALYVVYASVCICGMCVCCAVCVYVVRYVCMLCGMCVCCAVCVYVVRYVCMLCGIV
jgi:hypothetical protein